VWKTGDHPPEYPHVRRVEWEGTVSRDEFTTSTKNTLGSTLTVLSLDDCIEEITGVLSGETPEESEDEEDTVPSSVPSLAAFAVRDNVRGDHLAVAVGVPIRAPPPFHSASAAG